MMFFSLSGFETRRRRKFLATLEEDQEREMDKVASPKKKYPLRRRRSQVTTEPLDPCRPFGTLKAIAGSSWTLLPPYLTRTHRKRMGFPRQRRGTVPGQRHETKERSRPGIVHFMIGTASRRNSRARNGHHFVKTNHACPFRKRGEKETGFTTKGLLNLPARNRRVCADARASSRPRDFLC
jgi:hypothetical protein